MLLGPSTYLVLITMAIVALVDYVPRLINSFKKSTYVPTTYTRIPEYLILPTVYGKASYLSYLEDNPFLRKYRKNVIICTTLYESREFYVELKSLCKKNGFRYRMVDTKNKHGDVMFSAYSIYKGFFKHYSRMNIKDDTPCLIMDVDTFTKDNVNNLIRAFIARGYDVASLRCHIDNPKTLIEKLQQFEYKIAMDNRKMDPWMVSGAASLGKAKAFQHIFSRHSDFFAGGDSEIGKLAKVMDYNIGFIDFLFLTAAPDTWKDWFNQRVIWFSGGFRHHIINMGNFGWQHFFILFYNSLIIYLLLPLRWFELINYPQIIPFLILLSWLYNFVLLAGRGWSKELLVLPLYGFVQSMIIVPFGIYRYIKLVKHHKSSGLLNFDLSKYSFSSRLMFKGLNAASAMIVIYSAVVITGLRLSYWSSHSWFL